MSWIRTRTASLGRTDRRGTVTVFVAIWLLVIFGISAVGVDGGYWYLQRRQQQNAADMAAIAGAVQLASDVQNGSLNSNGTPAVPVSSTTSVSSPAPTCTSYNSKSTFGVRNAALDVSGDNGFANSPGGTCVQVNWPPTSGAYTLDTAVEVIVHKPAPLLLSAFVRMFAGPIQRSVGARAVAIYGELNRQGCVLQLDSQGTFEISGSSKIYAPNCSFIADSTQMGGNSGNDPSSAAFYVNGNTGTGKKDAQVSASQRQIQAIASMGSCINCGTATADSSPYLSGAAYTPDPFANTAGGNTPLSQLASYFETNSPDNKALQKGKVTNYQSDTTLSAGEIYGIKVTANANLTLSPGLYVIGAGGLDVASGSSISCSGCTIMLTNGGTATINGSSTQVLEAPSPSTSWIANMGSGFYSTYPQFSSPSPGVPLSMLQTDLSGVLFYGDGTGTSTINGTSGSTFAGALYFPNSLLQLSGNSGINGSTNSSCLMAVAGNITFIGNDYTGLTTQGCGDMGLPSVYVHYVKLVE